MADNVTLNAGTKWTPTAIAKLRELWEGGVPTETIASVLGRAPAEIGAKAMEQQFQRRH